MPVYSADYINKRICRSASQARDKKGIPEKMCRLLMFARSFGLLCSYQQGPSTPGDRVEVCVPFGVWGFTDLL